MVCFEVEEEEEGTSESFPFDLEFPTFFRFLDDEEEEEDSGVWVLGWVKSMVRRGRSKP